MLTLLRLPVLVSVTVTCALSVCVRRSSFLAGAESFSTTVFAAPAFSLKLARPRVTRCRGLPAFSGYLPTVLATIAPRLSWLALTEKVTALPSGLSRALYPFSAGTGTFGEGVGVLVVGVGAGVEVVGVGEPPAAKSAARWSCRFTPFGAAGVPFGSLMR